MPAQTEGAGAEPLREVAADRRSLPHDPVIATALGRRDALTRRLLALADMAALTAAMALAPAIAGARQDPGEVLLICLMTLPVWLVIFKLYGLYDRDIKRISHATLDDLPWLFHALLIGGLLLWVWVKIQPIATLGYPSQLSLPESAIFGVTALVLVSAFRSGVRRATIGMLGPERVLIAGIGPMTSPLVRKMEKHPEYGLNPIGLIGPEDRRQQPSGLEVLGELTELERLSTERVVERLVICRQDFSEPQVMEMISVCRRLCIKVSLLPAVFDALGPSVEIDEVEGVTVLGVNPPVLSRTSRLIKRSFDLIVAVPLLALATPLLLAIALAIKLDSPGPMLFRQDRIGREGRRFRLNKFRTMVVGAEERRAELLSASRDPNWLHLDHDPRVTRVGRLLRVSSLDELPQLWNVIHGEMSLVGPRPLIEEEDRRVDGWMRGRLDLQPGITGLWQVLGRTSIPFDEMVKLDYLYVSNWSLWFDTRILVRTLPVIFSRRGAN